MSSQALNAESGAAARSGNGANAVDTSREQARAAEEPVDPELPNPWLLKSKSAYRAFELIQRYSEGKGKLLDKAGREVNQKAPNECHFYNPEQHYDKPEGFALISRNFPCTSNDVNYISLVCSREMGALGLTEKEQTAHLQDFIKLNAELKATFSLKLRSKLKCDVNAFILQQGIKGSAQGSRVCGELTDLYKLFRSEIPTEGFFRDVYNAVILEFEDGELIDVRSYESMMEMKVWFGTGGEYDKLNITGMKGKLKQSSVRSIGRSKMRDFRKPFTERSSTLHKVTMTITDKKDEHGEGGRGKDRRQTKRFSMELVRGWLNPDHVKMIQDVTGLSPDDFYGKSEVARNKPSNIKPGNATVKLASDVAVARKIAPPVSSYLVSQLCTANSLQVLTNYVHVSRSTRRFLQVLPIPKRVLKERQL